MQDIYKIGFTQNSPTQRAIELSKNTSVAVPFEVVVYAESENAHELEKEFHELYKKYRVSKSREFFKFELHHLIREVCLNLEFSSINFTYCFAYAELNDSFNKSNENYDALLSI